MNKIKKILVALDLDETTEVVVNRACFLAHQFDAELVLLHVIEDAFVMFSYWRANKSVELQQMVSEAMDDVSKTLHDEHVDVDRILIEEGKPARTIVEVANSQNIDLVIAAASRNDLLERIVGTTLQYIVRHLNQPIWITAREDNVLNVKRTLVAIDCSPASTLTLTAAIAFCGQFGSELDILHVTPIVSAYQNLSEFNDFPYTTYDIVPYNIGEEFDHESFGGYNSFDDYLDQFELDDINYKYILKTGDPATIISETAEAAPFDLLVMGAVDSADSMSLFLRGNLDRVIANVHCSILTVKHPVKHPDN